MRADRDMNSMAADTKALEPHVLAVDDYQLSAK